MATVAITGCATDPPKPPPRGFAYAFGPAGRQTRHDDDKLFVFARTFEHNTIRIQRGGGRSRAITGPEPAYPTSNDSPSLSPDHRSVAYVHLDEPDSPRTQVSIRIRNISSGRTRTVLRHPSDHQDISDIAWAPDGKQLVVVVDSARPGIYALRLGTHTLKPLLLGFYRRSSKDGLRIPGSPDISPDGTKLLADYRDFATVLDLRTGRVRFLDQREVQSPVYSPDGHKIAYSTTREENGHVSDGSDNVAPASELHFMDADGTNDRRLTNTDNRDEGNPRWIDQHTLLYGDEGIWQLDITTGKTRQITSYPDYDIATAPRAGRRGEEP